MKKFFLYLLLIPVYNFFYEKTINKENNSMSDLFSEFEEDSVDYTQVPEDSELTNVKDLAEYANTLSKRIEKLTDLLGVLEGRFNEVTRVTLPERMRDLGLSTIGVTDGTKLELKEVVNARLPEDDAEKEKAYSWLEEEGHGDIISNVFSCEFKKGSEEEAKRLRELLQQNEQAYKEKKQVHWATLESLIKSLIKEGEEVPRDKFKIYEGFIVTLKKGKSNG